HDDAEALAEQAVEKKLSVCEMEKLARKPGKQRQPRKAAASANAEDADIAAVQDQLVEFLGRPVRITSDADPRSGAVTIRYSSLDQLDLVCQRLTGGEI